MLVQHLHGEEGSECKQRNGATCESEVLAVTFVFRLLWLLSDDIAQKCGWFLENEKHDMPSSLMMPALSY